MHCVAACQTSSNNFSVVSPFAAKMIFRCICYILMSLPSTVYESCPASTSQGCIHVVIICIFFCSSDLEDLISPVYLQLHQCSLVCACKDVPYFNRVNRCTGAKVHVVALISSYRNCVSLISTSIFFTCGSSCSEAHSSSVSLNSWLQSLTAMPMFSMFVLMVALHYSWILGGVVGCSFNCSSVICVCRSKWTLSTCAFDSLNASASYCTLSLEAASD